MQPTPKLTSKIIALKSAIAAVDRWHSHHGPPIGGLFAIGVFADDRIVCVAIVSRPVARMLQAKGNVVEVTRLASDRSVRGAASFALRECVREADKRGFDRVVSYTLLGEVGASYRAARWRPTQVSKRRREWDMPGRRRKPAAQPGAKVRWEGGKGALPRCMEAWNAVIEHAGKIELKTRQPLQQELSFNTATERDEEDEVERVS